MVRMRSAVRIRPAAPKCVDKKDTQQKRRTKVRCFCIFTGFSLAEKLGKTFFSENQFFHARGDISEMQQSTLADWCDLNTEAKKE